MNVKVWVGDDDCVDGYFHPPEPWKDDCYSDHAKTERSVAVPDAGSTAKSASESHTFGATHQNKVNFDARVKLETTYP